MAGRSLATRGLVITGPRELSLQTLDLSVPEREHVRIRVELCGLCTWEQRVYRGDKSTYPFWGGHEVCGIVEEVRGEVFADLSPGDRVALALMRRCGQCRLCKRGLDNHCVYVRPEPKGTLPQGPKGLSERMLVPPYQAFRLTHEVSAAKAVLVEPLACVMRSIRQGRPSPGELAVVLGGGTMGLIHTMLLRGCGARVIVCEDDEALHSRARSAGADLVFPLSDPGVADEIRRASDGQGADTVFCTRGGGRGVEMAAKAAARGGRVVLYQSIRASDLVALNANDLHYREVELVGTISQTAADFQRAVEWICCHPEAMGFLATEVVGLGAGREAFERARDPHVNRVLVSCEG